VPGISTVLAWRPDELDPVSDTLAARRRTLVDLQDELDGGAPPTTWNTGSATMARTTHEDLRSRLADLVAEVSQVVTALDTGRAAIRTARDQLEDALDHARSQQFSVDTATGRVTDTACYADEDVVADRQATCNEITDRIEQALRNAAHADNELAEALLLAAGGSVDGGDGDLSDAVTLGADAGHRDLLPPPEGGSAADHNAWWNGLTDDEKIAVIEDHARWIGNTDGIPAYARDLANRRLIDDYRAELEAEAERLQDNLDDNWFGGTFTNDDARLEQVRGKLDSLDAVEEVLALGDRQLLLLDPYDGEQMHAAVAVGNVDTADHVAVFTPGLTSTVQDSLAGYDSDMRELNTRASDESFHYGDGGTVATVSWIGYDAPQWGQTLMPSRSVASDDLAQAGADDLAGFYNGIDTSRGNDPHVTALGHSYGSLTTGLALQNRTGVDDMVIFGSPGLGTSDLGDLDIPDGHAFRIEARRDVVADLGSFGIDPSHLDGIDGLSAGESDIDGERFDESTGHSAYLSDHTTSQHNIASVVAGAPDRMVHDGGRGLGDVLSWPVPGTY
jgi:hypothetical protein